MCVVGLLDVGCLIVGSWLLVVGRRLLGLVVLIWEVFWIGIGLGWFNGWIRGPERVDCWF